MGADNTPCTHHQDDEPCRYTDSMQTVVAICKWCGQQERDAALVKAPTMCWACNRPAAQGYCLEHAKVAGQLRVALKQAEELAKAQRLAFGDQIEAWDERFAELGEQLRQMSNAKIGAEAKFSKAQADVAALSVREARAVGLLAKARETLELVDQHITRYGWHPEIHEPVRTTLALLREVAPCENCGGTGWTLCVDGSRSDTRCPVDKCREVAP